MCAIADVSRAGEVEGAAPISAPEAGKHTYVLTLIYIFSSMRLRFAQQVCKLSSFGLQPFTFRGSRAVNGAGSQQSYTPWMLSVRQGRSMSCAQNGHCVRITTRTGLQQPTAFQACAASTTTSTFSPLGDESGQETQAAKDNEAALSSDSPQEMFSPHPERRNMRNDPSYVPVASPYAAQNPVARVERKVFARVRDVPQSVKKMNYVARVVRRLHIDDALVQTSFHNTKKAARLLHEILMSARAAARHRNLHIPNLVVDEVLVLRAAYARRPPIFRAKGGVNMPRRSSCHVYVRLREVPGANMKAAVCAPWWERRNKHHRNARDRKHRRSENLIATRSQLMEAAAGTAAM